MQDINSIRRVDRAQAETPLRKPLAGASALATQITDMVREGDLYEKLPDHRVHCFACAHNCNINDGGRGICQVRYNVGGTLFVPRGYVAALQCDPVEKKPFFHVLPSSDALTFGMLGCDLHCAYCFTGDTMVVTKQGVTNIAELFGACETHETKSDGEIGHPENSFAMTKTGAWQNIEAVFKHPYRGELTIIHPYYFPALRCTPDHRLFATDNPAHPPMLTPAAQLSTRHYLAIPRHFETGSTTTLDIQTLLAPHQITYRVSWGLTPQERTYISEQSDNGASSREIGQVLGKSGSYIRHLRTKLKRGHGLDTRTSGAYLEDGFLRFPNEHRPGIPSQIPLNNDFAELLGYYCAEGSVVSSKKRPNSHSVNFSFSHAEKKVAARVSHLLKTCLGVHSSYVNRASTFAVTVSKASVALLFKTLCGAGANEKHVPSPLYSAPKETRRAFLDAYTLGDGHIYENGKHSATTVSTSLAYGIAWLALQAGFLPSLYDTPREPQGQILGRQVRQAPHQYSVVWYENADITRRVVETDDDYLIPLREIECQNFDGHVYNLQVANQHTYLANFFAVSNCQNWDISQALRDPESGRPPSLVTPQQLVEIGKEQKARIVASSYNEPLITSEWAVEIFKQATDAGFLCAYVSNGNATRQVLEYIKPYVRAYKIDLKSMRDKNYRQLGAPLNHILDGIKMVHEMGFWLEIVTLVIPGFNDSDEELRDAANFLASLSPNIPWHVTAFHQDYKMLDKDSTSVRDLVRACEIGREAGLNFVYAGNLPGHVGTWENTYCPNCRALLIERYGYLISAYHITDAGTCPKCGTVIPGIWHSDKKDVRLGEPDAWWMRRPRPV